MPPRTVPSKCLTDPPPGLGHPSPSCTVLSRSLTDPPPGPDHHSQSHTVPSKSLTDPLPRPGHHSPSQTASPKAPTDPLSRLGHHSFHTASPNALTEPLPQPGSYSPSYSLPSMATSDPLPGPGRRTAAQLFRRRIRRHRTPTSLTNTANTQDQGALSETRLQRVGASISGLLVPEHQVGEPPGFVREVKNILFGSCASWCPSVFGYMWSSHTVY